MMHILEKNVMDLANEYANSGVVVVRNALNHYWLEVLRSAVDCELGKGKRYFAYRNMRTREGPFRDFCLTSGIGRMVAEIAGSSKVVLLFDQMFVKEPGSNTRTGWHSDQPYWPFAGDIMTLWIALDPVNADNGALEFIKGSHDIGVMYRPFLTDQMGDFKEFLKTDDPRYVDLPDFESERDKHEILSWNLEAGDLLAFNGQIAHAATANQSSSDRRRGYAIRFAMDGATYVPSQGVADWLGDPSLEEGAQLESAFFPSIHLTVQQT